LYFSSNNAEEELVSGAAAHICNTTYLEAEEDHSFRLARQIV
jgi:hypothetical protein